MFGSSKKKKPSLLKRLLYLVVLVSGSGGFGGWALQDHPQLQTLLKTLVGDDAGSLESLDAITVKKKVATAVVGVLKKTSEELSDEFSEPGVYQVSIPKVTLDPAEFKEGRTVDVQAKVIKLDPRGRDMTIWDSRPFGERLVVAGKGELSTGWPVRYFKVPWSPGDQVVVEIYDARGGLFVQPKRFALTPAGPGVRDFPLRSGTFALVPIRAAAADPGARGNRIEFRSRRVGDLDPVNPQQVAERPILIK